MLTGDRLPKVTRGITVGEAIKEMDAKRIGATLVVGSDDKIAGIVTDGDLRRALIQKKDVNGLKVEEIMSSSPKTIQEGQTIAEALGLMELYGIMHLVILDRDKRLMGVVHLHDLLGREAFKLNGVPGA